MYGNSRAASWGDRSEARFFVEKTMGTSREAKLCGIDLRPVPGLGIPNALLHTADAVGYDLAPFGLDGEPIHIE
jgi:hypothetical protein